MINRTNDMVGKYIKGKMEKSSTSNIGYTTFLHPEHIAWVGGARRIGNISILRISLDRTIQYIS
jgi:hypothetical protein